MCSSASLVNAVQYSMPHNMDSTYLDSDSLTNEYHQALAAVRTAPNDGGLPSICGVANLLPGISPVPIIFCV